jgi:hypothetical protein
MPLPKLAWDFNGTTTPYIGTATGTTTGSISYTPGKFNQGISFPNSSGTGANYVSYSTTSIPVDSGITVALWVKFNQLQDSYFFVMGSIFFKTQGAGMNWFMFNNNQYPGGGLGTYAVNTWYHLVLSISNMSVGAYINGALQATTAYTTSGTTVANPRIGAEYNQGINGLIDDLRIFDRALTSAQVQAIYNQQGVPGRGAVTSSTYLPTLPGYSLVAVSKLPSSFTLTQTSTGNVWTYNTGLTRGGGNAAIMDGGAYPAFICVPDPYNYTAQNPGIWCSLREQTQSQYIRHANYGMWYFSPPDGSFDFAWAFFLKNGTTNQVKVWNPYPGNGVGWWVQSGAGRIAISTTDPLQAHIYTISVPPSPPTSLTGTPLFTQLSPSATSSAVGAFSLRAVNGTSARAVNVKKITITDSSSSPVLPTLSTSVTSNVLGPFSTNGSLFYNATGSPWPTPSKMQFDLFTSGNVFMECFVYFSTAPTSNFPALFYRSGQISVYFNNNSTLTLAIYNSTGGNAISPLTIGSIPLNTWRHVSVSINQQTSTAYASINGSVVSASYTLGGSNYNSSNPFYLLINNPVPVNISSFRCVSGAATLPYITTFTPPSSILTAYSSGTTIELLDGVASSTDFYADRLGNLLTAPVVGQSLANWLGGATGYVTTWYDQSGTNHATQDTAALQPKIDLVNKQIDFKPSAYFNLPNGTVPFGNTNYTMIVKHNTINAVWGGIIGSGTYGTTNGVNALEWNSTAYFHYWWGNDMSGGTLTSGNVVSAKYDNTIGRTLYVNGTSVDTNTNKNRNSTNIQNTIGTDLRGNQGQSGGNRYLNGELYYVFLFGTALSDTDRTLVEALPIT